MKKKHLFYVTSAMIIAGNCFPVAASETEQPLYIESQTETDATATDALELEMETLTVSDSALITTQEEWDNFTTQGNWRTEDEKYIYSGTDNETVNIAGDVSFAAKSIVSENGASITFVISQGNTISLKDNQIVLIGDISINGGYFTGCEITTDNKASFTGGTFDNCVMIYQNEGCGFSFDACTIKIDNADFISGVKNDSLAINGCEITITGSGSLYKRTTNSNVSINMSNTSVNGNNSILVDARLNSESDKVIVKNCTFTECHASVLDFSRSGQGSVAIQNCDISGDADDYAVNSSYSSLSVDMDSVTINGMKNGINIAYRGYISADLNDIHIKGCETGMEALNCVYILHDSEIECDGTANSIGVKSTYNVFFSTMERVITEDGFCIRNVTIKNANTGITSDNGNTCIEDCIIENCDSGFTGNTLYARNCTFTGTQTPSDNSYGIRTTGNGIKGYNLSIKGFRNGARNSGGTISIVNSVFDNIDTNIDHGYNGYLVNCELLGAKTCVSNEAPLYLVDCDVKGDNASGSIGLLSRSVYLYIYDSEIYGKEVQNTQDRVLVGNNDTMYMYQLLKNEGALTPKKMTVSGYETGVKEEGGGLQSYGLDLKDCTTGIKSTSGNQTHIYGKTTISDCNTGYQDENSYLYLDGPCGLYIHDCTTDGMNLSSTFVSCFNSTSTVEIEECGRGAYMNNTRYMTQNSLLDVHDNEEDGVVLDGTNGVFYAYPKFSDNGGYNLKMLQPSTVCIYGDSQFKNASADNMQLMGSNVRIVGNSIEADDSEIYLKPGCYIYNSANTLNGVMNFRLDAEDCSTGRILQTEATEGIVPDDDNFISTHYFMVNEGYIPVRNVTDTGARQIVVEEGCIVEFDYEENGGTSWTGTNTRFTVRKGTQIDLTPSAIKEGYTFVGWNTDKDAETGLSEITGNTENITLYAIYKKDVDYTYHTLQSNYTKKVSFYNKQTQKDVTLDTQTGVLPEGYAFDSYIISDTEYNPGDTVSVTLNGADIYCVYNKTGVLDYIVDGVSIHTDTQTVKQTAGEESPAFNFTLKDIPDKTGYRANGYQYEDIIMSAGSHLITNDIHTEVKAVYEAIKATSIDVIPETLTLKPGDSYLLIAKVLPDDTLNKSVTWTSENADIAIVDQFGNVTAKKDGVVRIYAHTTDGSNLSDYSEVTVKTEERLVIVNGTLTDATGQPLRDKNVSLRLNIAPLAQANTIWAKTDENGYFSIKNVTIGEYLFTVYDGDDILTQCKISVSDSGKDDIDIVDKDEKAIVEDKIEEDTFTVNVGLIQEAIITPPAQEMKTPEVETPPEETAKTGDNTPFIPIATGMLLSGVGIISILRKKKGR